MKCSSLFWITLFLMGGGALSAAPLRTGAAAPDFSLIGAEGAPVERGKLNGKPLLIVFADGEDASKRALSQIADQYDYYSESELAILSAAVGISPESAQELQEELWLTYPLLADEHKAAAAAFGIEEFPGMVILDNNHFVRYAGEYLFDSLTVRKYLNEAMRQKVFFVTARQFQYTPGTITVRKGDDVLIKMISEDVEHGMYVDGYNRYVMRLLDREGNRIPAEESEHAIKPGELGMLSFKADRAGRFTLRCASTCGDFHPYMVGQLRVEPGNLFPASALLALVLGAGGLLLAFRGNGPRTDKVFGIIPLGWKFDITRFGFVRALFKSRWFPLVPIVVNLAFFTVILSSAYVGGFDGAGNYNFGVMLVWILWWVLLMFFMVPFIGRIWCMVCPFPLFGDWVQRGKLFLVGRHKSRGLARKWPTKWRNMWLPVLLFFVTTWFSAFFTVRPMATFILLGGIILLSVLVALVFEKRTFCLFVCPVSGFQGLYSNFSACEIRVKDPEVCKNHRPKTCMVGNEKGYGCPWMERPFEMNRNTNCGMCLECFKTCPHDNMALNIRPWGKDLVAQRKPIDDLYRRGGLDESFKALTMIGIFLSFFIVFQGPYPFLKEMSRAVTLKGFLTYIAGLTITDFVLVPGFFLLFIAASKLFSGNREVKLSTVFANFSNCLVPLGLAAWIAFSVGIILPNGSYLLHVISDPFAWGWNIFGTALFPWTPVLTWITPYAQAGLTLIGFAFALDYGYKLSRMTFASFSEARRAWVPMTVCLTAFTAGFLWLFAG